MKDEAFDLRGCFRAIPHLILTTSPIAPAARASAGKQQKPRQRIGKQSAVGVSQSSVTERPEAFRETGARCPVQRERVEVRTFGEFPRGEIQLCRRPATSAQAKGGRAQREQGERGRLQNSDFFEECDAPAGGQQEVPFERVSDIVVEVLVACSRVFIAV